MFSSYTSFHNVTKSNNASVVIEYPYVFLAPIKSVFNPIKAYVNVSIYNLAKNIEIEPAKLFSHSYSFVTILQTELKQDPKKSGHYSITIEAKYNGKIFSINKIYAISVSFNGTNKIQYYNNLIHFEFKV